MYYKGKNVCLCIDGKEYFKGDVITTIDGEFTLLDVGGKPRWVKGIVKDDKPRLFDDFSKIDAPIAPCRIIEYN